MCTTCHTSEGWETSCLSRTNHRKKTQHHDRLPSIEKYVHNIPHKYATQSLDDCRKHNAIANTYQTPIPKRTRHKPTRMLCRTTLLIPSRYFKRLQTKVARNNPPTATNRNPNRHNYTKNPKYIPGPQRKFLRKNNLIINDGRYEALILHKHQIR